MEKLQLIANDPWLAPYEAAVVGRHEDYLSKRKELVGKKTLAEFASGHLYFGLHRTDAGWVMREWAPNATELYLIGTMNGWSESPLYCFKSQKNGTWELELPADALAHGDLYKLSIHWEGGQGMRIPAWARRAVQDSSTKDFTAQVWSPEKKYQFKNTKFRPTISPLMIYECHIGMSSSEEKVNSYWEFKEYVLPRIARAGYNCIQIMAIQEHPYYGSFGYHVSNFFAASSRFGTPEELKELIDTAHGMGIAVIMDIVHSHAVKNELEGLGYYDGTRTQFFYPGERGEHPAWDSYCFDYGKNEVIHFLLSNCRYWLEEFCFDGFRFDGVTSMLYYDHGLGKAFGGYGDYYDGGQDTNAIIYLTLANELIHEVNPHALTIAEEMSGMPGLAATIEGGGLGFDYRMAMGQPDYWIKLIKEKRDEDWSATSIWWEMTNRRADEKTISYAESHDQALVGDKTIIFRLIDSDMYWHMRKGDTTLTVDRGLTLHKMIRLITASTINGGYLNFMGNEFGHPEWIDFPRDGNGWSYKYARRQWELADRQDLTYHHLADFDREMIHLLTSVGGYEQLPIIDIWKNNGDQVLAFMRDDLLFIFNFNPSRSFTGYGMLVPMGSYQVILNTDAHAFGGNGLIDETIVHSTLPDPLYKEDRKEWIKQYLPARSAIVLRRTNANTPK